MTSTTEAYRPMILSSKDIKKEINTATLITPDLFYVKKPVKHPHIPISSKKAQTGRADLITEYVDLQAFIELFLRLLDQAGLPLVNDPPLLDLTRGFILGSLQVQGHVKHFAIYRGGEAKTVHA